MYPCEPGRLPATIRRNASSTAGGGSTSRLPSEKSQMASAPRSRLRRIPSSNMRRIQDACSSWPAMVFETGIVLGLLSFQEFIARQQVDVGDLQARDGRIWIGEAKNEDGLVSANAREGIHILDVDAGSVQRHEDVG